MGPIRVVVVDDQEIVRSGIRLLLEKIDGVEVVAEAADGREALQVVRTHTPDIVLLDLSMPGLNGLDAAEQIQRRGGRTRVVLLTMHADERHVLRALRSGVAGYLLKNARRAELDVALAAVAAGHRYVSPALLDSLLRLLLDHGEAGAGAERLTPKQREVLQLVAEGRTSKEIAAALGIGIKTVETHRADIMDRLDIRDLAGLVRYAVREGLVAAE